MYTISKDFTFSAAHQLDLGDHPCSRLHGHNYVVRAELSARDLDSNDMVMDYHDLQSFGQYIDNNLDHRNLNQVLTNPTAEHLARHFYDILRERVHVDIGCAVGVSETPKTWAWYRP